MAKKKSGDRSGSRTAGKSGSKSNRLEDARARMYHDLLFEAAEEVFGAKGYDGATMQDIAGVAGVSLKTLYATFPTKQKLYEEVMTVRASAFLACTEHAMAESNDPIERIEHGVRAYVEFLLEHEHWLRIHLRSRIAWAIRPKSGKQVEFWKRGHDDFTKSLHEGIEQGAFYPGDPNEMSLLTQAIMQVQVAHHAEKGERDPEVVVASILTHVWRLLRPESTRGSV